VPKTLEVPREGFQILTRFDFCNLLGMRPVLQIHSAITPDFELLPCVFVFHRLSCTVLIMDGQAPYLLKTDILFLFIAFVYVATINRLYIGYMLSVNMIYTPKIVS